MHSGGKKMPMDFPGTQKERYLLEKGSAAEFEKGSDTPEYKTFKENTEFRKISVLQ